jgi:hypothetical protein
VLDCVRLYVYMCVYLCVCVYVCVPVTKVVVPVIVKPSAAFSTGFGNLTQYPILKSASRLAVSGSSLYAAVMVWPRGH